MDEYDFLVVGSGSGLDVANVVADRGQSVAIVEKGPLGGTCLNRGCIPSKMLLYHADVLETVERAGEFGIDTEVRGVDFAGVVQEVTDEVREDAESIERGLEASSDLHLYRGEGRFVDDRTLELVDGEDAGATLRAESVLIAAGARPAVPDIEGIASVDYLTSREALRVETPPDRLLIVGGGYIAAELAHFFGTFGSEVTIVGRRPHLLPQADRDVGVALTERYRERFEVYAGYEATAVAESGGEVTVEATRYGPQRPDQSGGDDGTEEVTVTGDELLLAAGRVPNTDLLNVEATGVDTDADGFVETDEYLRTTADGVWALGDIVGEYMLKHNANHEAKAVVRNLLGEGLEPVDYSAIPFAVFASPEVAGVGATESEVREVGIDYATRTYRYEDTARGDAMKAEGFVKPIIDVDGDILGCHVIGPQASSLIQEVVVAMTAGDGTVQDIRDAVHVHPALSEVIQRAFTGQFVRGGDHHDH